MKTLHWYLIKQVLATLVLTVSVFTAVLLMGNAMKEVLTLVVKGQASLMGLVKAFGLLIPFVISFSLPMGLLTTMLLVFGRFSADQELIAARAGGVSLMSLVTPILLVAVLLGGLSAWINMKIAPQCRVAYKELIYDLASTNPGALLAENTFVTEIPDHVIYIGKLTPDAAAPHKWQMENVLLNRLKGDELIQRTRAARGEVQYFPEAKRYEFRLFDAQMNVRSDQLPLILGGGDANPDGNAATDENATEEEVTADWMPMAGGEIVLPIDLEKMERRFFKPKLKYLTFNQLRHEMHRHGELLFVDANGTTAGVHYSTRDLPKANQELIITRDGETVGRGRTTEDHTLEHLTVEILEGEVRPGDRLELDRMPMKVQLHRQVSFSFAAIGFTLVSIPLGIRAHRRETTAGVAMALILIIIYYSFVILGQALEGRPEFFPHLIMWIPVFLFQWIGAMMLWRANRSTG